MSSISETPSEPAFLNAATSAAARDGPPETAIPASPQGVTEDQLPQRKYLDPNWANDGVPDTKFFKDYPPDAWGQEAAPNARVWKIYRDELTTADAAMLKSWNGTLDVLLIFAGLFSAVSTAFIVESYKFLQPDYTQYIANFLYAAATSNSTANGAINLPSIRSMGPPDSFFHPSTAQRWTNGLWFTSLVISLTVALLCILIKQWLDQYHSRTTSSAASLRSWARRHQFYYRGLNAWGVPTLISVLPLLLHVSLFLFFAGLALFLRPLDGAIANALLTILTFSLLFYLLSLTIPAWYIDCPSYTPVLAQARAMSTISLEVLDYLTKVLQRCSLWSLDGPLAWLRAPCSAASRIGHAAQDMLRLRLFRRREHFAAETSIINTQKFTLDAQALSTLLRRTNDPDIIDAGMEAIGAITAEPTLMSLLRDVPMVIFNGIDRGNWRAPLSQSTSSSAFDVITHARRARTMRNIAITYKMVPPWCQWRDCYPLVHLHTFLGLDGMLIQLMVPRSFDDVFGLSAAAFSSLRELLSAHLYKLLIKTESGQGGRLTLPETPQLTSESGLDRTTCLQFLHMPLSHQHVAQEHFMSCILLVFCAGDFAQAEPHERDLAMRIVLAEVDRPFREAAPTENGDGVTLAYLDPLFAFLASHDWRHANQEAARVFAHHLGLLSHTIKSSQRVHWAQLTGFAVFAQLPDFQQYVSRAGLAGYIRLLGHVTGIYEPEPFLQYWTCVATVMQHCSSYGPPFGTFIPDCDSLVGRAVYAWSYLNPEAPFLEHSFDTMLLKLLNAAIMIYAGTGLISSLGRDMLLALLRRRQRLQYVDERLVGYLFSGPLLTAFAKRFRRLIREIVLNNSNGFHLLLVAEAKHCARVSLDGMLHICDELENPSDGGIIVEEAEFVIVAEMRRGLQPGGELLGECDPSCECMAQVKAQPPAQSSRLTRWKNCILGRISAAAESAV